MATHAPTGRDVDKLDPMPDSLVMGQDQQYLVRFCHCCRRSTRAAIAVAAKTGRCTQAKHSLDKLFEGLLVNVLRDKPADPLQYIIDSLSLGQDQATQARTATRLLHAWCTALTSLTQKLVSFRLYPGSHAGS